MTGWEEAAGGRPPTSGALGCSPRTQDTQEHGQQQQHVGGEHGHRGHTDEQGQGQAVQGALHPCR